MSGPTRTWSSPKLEQLPEWPSLDRDAATRSCSSRPCSTTRESRHDARLIRQPVERTRPSTLCQAWRSVGRCFEISAATWPSERRLRTSFAITGDRRILLEKSDPAHEVISLSWLVNHRLLYLFALADTRGRRTREMSRPEENIHLWKMVAEENGCFDRPYAFANDHARFSVLPRGTLEPALHATRGLPLHRHADVGLAGLGKDTWLARHRPEPAGGFARRPPRPISTSTPPTNQGEVIQAGAGELSGASARRARLCLQRHEHGAADAQAMD